MVMPRVLWPNRAAIASSDMPRLIAWVARVWRSWWGVTWPMPAAAATLRSAAPTLVDEQQAGTQPLGSLVEPLVEHGLELGVQGDVAVVVELADRDAQPVGRADLHDGVDGEADEFAFAHAGAGEQLDGQADERVGVGAGSLEELGGGAVVEEPRQAS